MKKDGFKVFYSMAVVLIGFALYIGVKIAEENMAMPQVFGTNLYALLIVIFVVLGFYLTVKR